MAWRIEVKHKKGVFDAHGAGVQKSIQELGIDSISSVEVQQVYNLVGDLSEKEIKKVATNLLTDKVTQDFQHFQYDKYVPAKDLKSQHTVEIAYNLGVMDPVEASTIKGIKDLGIKSIHSVSTAKKYLLKGVLSLQKLDTIVTKVLGNKLIQHVVDHNYIKVKAATSGKKGFQLIVVDLLSANDKELMKLSNEGQLFLNINEMKAIQKHYKEVGRNPTDCELETIAQTWSEHCYHKTFRGNIKYTATENGKKKTKTINSLLKSTIAKATYDLDKDWCVSVFHDNAGVIKFDSDHHVCFKVETHNHPSALEPFGGANTGIGGVIRDILGTGLGAKPICNTDVFCFAPPDTPFKDLPPGTLHPKRVMKGVVEGVKDYGNKMGIPTVNGSILFDEKYIGNPLVYCGCVGIMPKHKVDKKVSKGDLIVIAGGKTGRDGIHGATFSSGELTTESETVSSGAVQIGDPIQEKKVLDALIKARDLDLFDGLTDCGAGGFSSAVGEMGIKQGARVYLEKIPLKYDGLKYMEIWISESQERMVFSVNPKKVDQFLKVFKEENVEAMVIGEFTGSGRLELYYNNAQVCDLSMEFLHEGNPKVTKEAVWSLPKLSNPKTRSKNLNESLLDCLAHYNVCSKEWVVRQYDHEVQGGSVIKPFVGVNSDAPSDASVIRPKFDSKRGIAVSNGINFRYGMIDPFWMAASCIDEAIRQVVAVGAEPSRIAILDNFCWGNPDKPDRLGSMVRAAEGCYKAAMAYETPFISGKDSLYNEYTEGNKSIAIPGTLLISAIAMVDDIHKTITMDFKKAGNLIYVVGQTEEEMGGSIYYDTLDSFGNSVPRVDFKKGNATFKAMNKSIKSGLIASAHDCSEGGIGVALAEMAFGGALGVTARLDKVPFKGEAADDLILFSESNSRFLVEVDPKKKSKFETQMKGISIGCIGTVEATSEFVVYGLDNQACLNTYIEDLKEAWQAPLRW